MQLVFTLLLLTLGVAYAQQIPLETKPYDEDEIAGLITKIIVSLEQLDVTPSQDYLYPPPQGLGLDISELEEWKDKKVLSLIQRLPISQVELYDRPHVMPGWKTVDYRQFEEARLALILSEHDMLDASDLVLFTQHTGDGLVILNTEHNTIRTSFDFHQDLPELKLRQDQDKHRVYTYEEGMHFKELLNNYRAWPTQPATGYLQAILTRIQEGRDVPNWGRIVALDRGNNTAYLDIQTRLIEDYHWPTASFRMSAWKASRAIDAVHTYRYQYATPWIQQSVEDRLVDLIVKISYATIRTGLAKKADVTFAPPEGHKLDLSLLKEGDKIDDSVLSFIKRLPMPRKDAQIPWGDRFALVDYTDPTVLASMRDISAVREGNTMPRNWTRPTDVVLFTGVTKEDAVIVYNTLEGSIRFFGDNNRDTRYSKHLNDADAVAYMQDYRRRRVRDPLLEFEKYFRHFMDRLIAATEDSLPSLQEARRDRSCVKYTALRNIMVDEYGFPGLDFRKDDWLRDREALFIAHSAQPDR